MSFPLIWALNRHPWRMTQPCSVRSLIFIAINILLLRSAFFLVNVAVPGRAVARPYRLIRAAYCSTAALRLWSPLPLMRSNEAVELF